MSDSAIAKQLGVTDITVAKAIAWAGRIRHQPGGQKDVRKLTFCVEELSEGRSR